MKNLKKDLQAISKELKTLVSKVEKLGKALDKAAKAAIKPKATKKATKKKVAKKSPAKTKAKAKVKAPAKKKTAAKKKAAKKAAPTAIDSVVGIVKRSKNGVDVNTLMKKTGFDAKKISNIVYKAKKRGDIKSGAKGVYIKA